MDYQLAFLHHAFESLDISVELLAFILFMNPPWARDGFSGLGGFSEECGPQGAALRAPPRPTSTRSSHPGRPSRGDSALVLSLRFCQALGSCGTEFSVSVSTCLLAETVLPCPLGLCGLVDVLLALLSTALLLPHMLLDATYRILLAFGVPVALNEQCFSFSCFSCFWFHVSCTPRSLPCGFDFRCTPRRFSFPVCRL